MLDEWSESIAAERSKFVDELVSRGFTLDEITPVHKLSGPLAYGSNGSQVEVEIALPDGWPYRPTKIWPADRTQPLSWHQEANGALCLFTESAAGLPWANVDEFLDRASKWFAKAADGWPNDEPDLDLERYFGVPIEDELLVYEEIESLLGGQIRVRHVPGANNRLEARASSGKARPTGSNFGWALDLGELETPVRTWEEIVLHAGDVASRAARLIKSVDSAVILLRYKPGTHEGVVALRAREEGGKVHLTRFESADKGSSTLRLRAGYDAPQLGQSAVTIVGIGAIGSVLADQLSRSGIRKLRLVDGERIRPGNSIRHLVSTDRVGERKAAAVAAHIKAAGHAPPGGLEVVNSSVRVPDEAERAFESADLVVDATGNAATKDLLVETAEVLRHSLLVVYLQRDGDVARVERYPQQDDEDREPPAPPGPTERETLRESGCGDPISPAPSSAAVVAAGLASLAAADLLVGRPVPAAATYVLRPQLDEPYQRRAVLQ